MPKTSAWVSLAALMALAACASAGSVYHAASAGTKNSIGYSDEQVGTGGYRVSFVAPDTVGQQGVQDLALLRAAELTLSKGHTWFELVTTTTQEVQVGRPRQTFSQSSGNMECNSAASSGPMGSGGVTAGSMGCHYTYQGNSVAGVTMGTEGGYETRLINTIAFTMGDGAMPAGPQFYDAKSTVDKMKAEMKITS